MKRVGSKWQKIKRRMKAERDAFVESHLCMVCEMRTAAQCHEMARGAHREKAYQDRIAWLAVCLQCHDDIDDTGKWTVAAQLVLKQIGDIEFYNRIGINVMRSTDPEAVTDDDVQAAVADVMDYREAIRHEIAKGEW